MSAVLKDFKDELKGLFLKYKIHSLYPNAAQSIHFIGLDIEGKFVVDGMTFVCIDLNNKCYQIKE